MRFLGHPDRDMFLDADVCFISDDTISAAQCSDPPARRLTAYAMLRPMTTRLFGLVAATSTVAVLVAGCGGSDDSGKGGGQASSSQAAESTKSASQIMADMQKVTGAASSVHAQGTINGQQLNLVLTRDGKSGGTVGTAANPQKIVVLSASEVYGATKQSNMKFVRLDQSDARTVAQTYAMSALVTKVLTPSGAVNKNGTATVGGQKVVVLKSAKTGGILDIADDAAHPYPVRLTNARAGQLNYSKWNQPAKITAPPTVPGS